MSRLALFLPSLRGGGAERVFVTLANALGARGHDVDLLAVAPDETFRSDVANHVSVTGLRTVPAVPTEVPPAFPALVRYLRRARPDTLLSTVDSANLVALWASKVANVDTRTVVRLSGFMSPRPANTTKERVTRTLLRRWYPTADRLVAVSSDVKAEVVSMAGIDPAVVDTILNPIDRTEVAARKNEPVDCPLFSESAPVIVSVGNLKPAKQLSTLIRSFAALHDERPCRLLILGEGSQRAELEELATDLGVSSEVSMPGFVDNPYAYVAASDLFVLSSAWDACPNALLEALACGTTVVSTDCRGGASDILAHGKYGLLVPPGESEDMARAMDYALDHLFPESTLLARVDEFSVDRIVTEYEHILTVD